MSDLLLENSKKRCLFCKRFAKNFVKYGPLYRVKDITVHYYCVLLSNRMRQHGNDNEGMLGFLLRDIKKEYEKSVKEYCLYCKKGHATLKCWSKLCKATYHYTCGKQNGALFQFFGQYKHYCSKHRPQQVIPKVILSQFKHEKTICPICQEKVSFNLLHHILWAPCCQKTFFHRSCLQEMAHSAGYLFKCPICSDSKKFRNRMLHYGLHIPNQDASWELVPNAFEELLFRYNRCDADECMCPDGRNKDAEDTMWEIVLCRSCGSQGMHIKCGKLKFKDPQWECPMCERVVHCNEVPAKVKDQSNDVILKNKSNEEILGVPSSSNIESSSFTRKRMISESINSGGPHKRKKYSADRMISENKKTNTLIKDDIEVDSSGEISHKKEKVLSSNCDKSSKAANDNVAVEVKDQAEIIISSSDSECEIIDILDSSSEDEMEVIDKIVKPSLKTKSATLSSGPLGFGTYLYENIRSLTPLTTFGRGNCRVLFRDSCYNVCGPVSYCNKSYFNESSSSSSGSSYVEKLRSQKPKINGLFNSMIFEKTKKN